MHLKRRARPLFHASGPILGLRARRQRIRAYRLIDERERHVVCDHAHEDFIDVCQTAIRVFAGPEAPGVIRT
jgi:hypothetical protein